MGLGFDVMLTSQRKPYLIEVNHLPSLGCSSHVDVDVKRRLISQTLDITCGELPTTDQESYENLSKKRFPPACKFSPLLDCVEYKDFLRILPPTEKCPPELATEYGNVVRRVREVFKPLHYTSRRASAISEREATTSAREPSPARRQLQRSTSVHSTALFSAREPSHPRGREEELEGSPCRSEGLCRGEEKPPWEGPLHS